MIKNKGYVYALLSALLFGASTPAAKGLISSINPWLLAGLFYLGSGIGLAIIFFLRVCFFKQSYQNIKLSGKDWLWLMMATILGGIIGPVLLMFALVMTQASAVSLLLNLEGVFTALIAWIIFKEHTDKRLIFGVILIIIGSVLLSLKTNFHIHNFLSIIFVAGACLAWAMDNNITRKISAIDPLKIVVIKNTIAGATNTILAIFYGGLFSVNIYILGIAASVGFIGYGVSLILFIFALRYIGTARTSAYFALAPFVGACLAVIFLHDPLSWQLIVAALLMATGVWLHLTEYHDHEHQHETLTHTHQHTHDEHHQHEHLPSDPGGEPHTHLHTHLPLLHSHPHYPDIHHRHRHK